MCTKTELKDLLDLPDKELRSYLVVKPKLHKLDLILRIVSIPTLIGALFTILTFANQAENLINDISTKTFDDLEQKVLVLQHVKAAPEEGFDKTEKRLVMNHIEDKDKHMPREIKDKLYVNETDYVKDKITLEKENEVLRETLTKLEGNVFWIKNFLITNGPNGAAGGK